MAKKTKTNLDGRTPVVVTQDGTYILQEDCVVYYLTKKQMAKLDEKEIHEVINDNTPRFAMEHLTELNETNERDWQEYWDRVIADKQELALLAELDKELAAEKS